METIFGLAYTNDDVFCGLIRRIKNLDSNT